MWNHTWFCGIERWWRWRWWQRAKLESNCKPLTYQSSVFLQSRCPSCHQPTVSKHWSHNLKCAYEHQCTDKNFIYIHRIHYVFACMHLTLSICRWRNSIKLLTNSYEISRKGQMCDWLINSWLDFDGDLDHDPGIQVKVNIMLICTAPAHGTSLRRSGIRIALIVERYHSLTCTPCNLHFIRKRNEPYLPLPSQI